jgi:DNA-binding CsgD family transcriptional regulator
VRNNLGNESAITSYSLNIQPPWYQTILARVLYLLLAIGTILLIYKWQKKKFNQQEAKYEEEQKKLRYIHELEKDKAESELMNLKNEKLESEINFKNTELASSAMHLVKKGELLTKIKSDLSHVIKTVENKEAKDEVKKIIRSLNEDESIDSEWENFTKHFDKVHSDFLIALKEKHPSITPNELKLCAYLRMNLSTKEIAQLLNISVRGVEISRYRLRKKLTISSGTNLFDYLINIQSRT